MDNPQDPSSQISKRWKQEKRKIFLRYIISEPYEQIKCSLGNVSQSMKRPKNLILVLLILEGIAVIKSANRFVTLAILLFLVLLYVYWEWEDGTFMKKYRDSIYKR